MANDRIAELIHKPSLFLETAIRLEELVRMQAEFFRQCADQQRQQDLAAAALVLIRAGFVLKNLSVAIDEHVRGRGLVWVIKRRPEGAEYHARRPGDPLAEGEQLIGALYAPAGAPGG